MALIVAVLGAVLALAGAMAVAASITTGLHEDQWAWHDVPQWIPIAAKIAYYAGDPALALEEPWASGVRHRTVQYWAAAVALAGAVGGLVSLLAVPTWRLYGPTAPGHATRHDLRRHLSLSAARRAAEWTRGDLPAQQRRAASADEISVPLHRGPHKQTLVTNLETPTGVIAPTRSGKSRQDLIHKVLAAPGALLASTTKPDLAEWGLLARARRPSAGPVLLCDATGTIAWPATVRWSPIRGCIDPAVALRRADTLIEASALGLQDIGGNDKVFRGRATIVLQTYLLAAAKKGRNVSQLVAWAITKPPDPEPADILQRDHPELSYNLRAEIGMVAETSDAVWMSVRRALEPFMNPSIRAMCTPPESDSFEPRQFLQAGGSLFLIAGEHQAPHARPVLTALAEDILTTAQDLALEQPRRRIEPPTSAVLDELFGATPVPRLPSIISESAGRGVLIHWAAQSRSQLDELFGEAGRRQLIDNTVTLTAFGGIKDDATLEWLSTIASDHRRRTWQQHSDGMLAAGRTSTSLETTPTYRPGEIRSLAHGRVLILHSNLLPIQGRTVDVSRRPDWPQLQSDADTVRRGRPPVDAHGYLHPPTSFKP
ncbi:TraM recognition domain-containing protein [Saccharothrix sp. AJ9571]|nr:TraM recognition domain-containing protein [Saccharothrix sp. AJ9571]